MDKQGRVVIGNDWDGTMRDSITQFMNTRFRSSNVAVRMLSYLSFAFVDLLRLGTNASNNIEHAHVEEVFRNEIRENAKDNIRTVCSTRNNHKNQIRARLKSEGVRDPEGVPDVIHSKDEETQKEYRIDISVNDSLIREFREGRKNENYIMWAGYSHNAVFGKLFRKLGYTNVAMNGEELQEICRDRVEKVRRAHRTMPEHATGQLMERQPAAERADAKASTPIRYK
jgi:hypothetical protein